MASITVIGAGYVGLVSAACFASLGHTVRCVEKSPERLSKIRDNQLPISEPSLDGLVARGQASGALSFSGEIDESLNGSEFAFVAVPTPQTPSGAADMSAVMAVCGDIAEHAAPGSIVTLKSTVPVGAGDHVASMLGPDLPVVSNPEFLREGSAVRDFLLPDRILIGASEATHAEAVASLYAGISAPVMVCDRRSAELAKYASNSYLATRLSFINEIARICDATGADIDQVSRAMSFDPRIGSLYLSAGIGWGGSCLPKDVAALAATAERVGVEPHMLRAAQVSNDAQIETMVHALDRELDGLEGKVIALMGLSFKAGTDDTRESPALAAAARLAAAGAIVRGHDPLATIESGESSPTIHICDSVDGLTREADAVILSTDWAEYLSLDWSRVASVMRGRLVFDARNALSPKAVEDSGLRYLSFGRRPQIL